MPLSPVSPRVQGAIPWLLLIAAIWAQLFYATSYAWRHGNYYDYGWYVPPLAVLFFIRIFSTWDKLRYPFWSISKVISFAIPFVCLLIILRILEQVDPSWTLPLWIHAAVVSCVTLLMVHRAAERLAALRLAPILIFALTAVQLPTFIEQHVVDTLTRGVIETSSWLLQLFGRPVVALGSQLELLGQTVHVTEGCSGIRSVQSFLMTSLFFGEWMQLSARNRVVMLAMGLATAWILNVARACSLAVIRFDYGSEAFNKAHDTVGLIAFFLGAGVLLWISSSLDSDTRGAVTAKRLVARRVV